VAITFTAKLDNRKSKPESWCKKNGNKLSDEKGRKVTSLKNTEGYYVYKTFYDALTTPDNRIIMPNSVQQYQKIKNTNLISEKMKVLEVDSAIKTALATKCKTTYIVLVQRLLTIS
jgi:hypothetical protein